LEKKIGVPIFQATILVSHANTAPPQFNY